MNIYIVNHYWDNGEVDYEDRVKYSEQFMYSTRELAEKHYYSEVADNYIGEWSIIKKTLDTQEEKELERSPWVTCLSPYYDEDYSPEPDDYYDYRQPEPEDSIITAWKYMDEQAIYEDICYSQEIEEYLNAPHENYEIFKQLEADALEDLNKALDSLLTH